MEPEHLAADGCGRGVIALEVAVPISGFMAKLKEV
jgi:hypothetical protein